MEMLLLGGTAFLGLAIARAAMAAGWEVTCLARGSAGGASPNGETTITGGASPNGETTTTGGASPNGETTTTGGASPGGETTTTGGASSECETAHVRTSADPHSGEAPHHECGSAGEGGGPAPDGVRFVRADRDDPRALDTKINEIDPELFS